MPRTARDRPARRSEARERLLATASQLFYSEGTTSVGVDRIVSESHVTLATFYRHFPGKQDLVVAYLQGAHDTVAERATALTERAKGRELVRGSAQRSSPRSDTRGSAAAPSSTPPRSSRTLRAPCASSSPPTAAGTTS
jgi:AcrR family transcriptional regulator